MSGSPVTSKDREVLGATGSMSLCRNTRDRKFFGFSVHLTVGNWDLRGSWARSVM